ncbi:MAG: DoxX family membrane protein, partial [Bacteroidetes bacterium]|nr:DoxX family membrane protein [Bacteroidota bacterium]
MDIRLVKTGRLILSVLFIFSGLSKLLSLPFFDGMVAELFIGVDYYDHPQAMWFSQLFTRVVISGELLLGAAILQDKYFKSIILPVMQLMLIGFTAHLVYAGMERGFVEGNCGCFGDVLPMTNLESIIKNVVAMGIGLFLWKFHIDVEVMRFKSWVMPATIGAVSLGTLLLTVRDYSP